MRKVIVFSVLILSIAGVCSAQSDQSESLTISTYYPSPYGVYKTLRLYPSDPPLAGSPAIQPGTMYFNRLEQKLYIYNGSLSDWEKIGSNSSGGSALIVDSGHKVWPDWCKGVLTTRTIGGGHGTASLCSHYWNKNITFSKTFSKPPRVFVTAEVLSGSLDDNMNDLYTCAEHSTDVLVAYADAAFITNKTFVLSLGSSAGAGSNCCSVMDCKGASDWQVTEYYGKGEAAWVAIGN
jgi:hypothetical protein